MTSSFREYEKFTKRPTRHSKSLSEKELLDITRKQQRAQKRSYDVLEGIYEPI